MDYAILTLDLPAELAEPAAALLHGEGALGVEVRDADGVAPGARPPAPGRAEVLGYFEGAAPVDDVARTVVAALGSEGIRASTGRCRDEDWAETWKAHFKPIHIGRRLWVLPPWATRPGGPTVVLEPGMAFGTGAHETTALCLELLVELLPERPGARVLDVGCGSGILGIAARVLGAGQVVLVDNDPEVIGIARHNAEENGCPDLAISRTPIQQVEGLFEIVVANILSTTLVELAAPIAARRALGGAVLLSGILTSQADEVRDAFEAHGLVERERRVAGEWVVLRLEGR